jgi:hypothetical protein
MDVDARDSLSAEHVPIARVVLEGELKIKSVLAKVFDRASFESRDLRVVASIAHDEQVPAKRVVRQPRESLRHHSQRSPGQQDDTEGGLEQTEQVRDILDQWVLAACIEERIPVPPLPLEKVLPAGRVRQDSVDIEHDGSPRLGRTGPPAPIRWTDFEPRFYRVSRHPLSA